MPIRPRTSAVLALLLAAACGGDPPADPGPGPDTEVASLVIAGGDLSFASLGVTQQLTATAKNADGDVLTPTITWSVAGGGVASVSGTGLVTSKANGNATITATAGSKSATVQVNVTQVATGIAITTPPTQLTIAGATLTLAAAVHDANNRPIADAPISWSSSAPEVLPVRDPGVVTAVGAGNAVITATAGTLSDDVTLTVKYTGSVGPAITGAAVPCTGGMAGPFPCSNLTLMSFLPLAALGVPANVTLNDIWAWVDPLTQKEYAIVLRRDGTTFVDVSDPLRPRYLGFLPIPPTARPNWWHDAKVYQNHAFIVSDGALQHGMQVFDLTELRNITIPRTFSTVAHYTPIASAHNIFINEATGFAYSVGGSSGGTTCGGGLHMINIQNPTNPTFAGCFADPATGWAGTGYTHDVQCVVYHGPDAGYTGREICFGSNESALSIADVTDKQAPVAISHASYPAAAYSHQGWLTADQRHFLMNDELDELDGSVAGTRTLIWDVSELDDPILVGQYLGPTPATDHNHYITGGVMYASNYQFGMRMVNVSNPLAPVQIGYFDTAPNWSNTPGFEGSWSNYPFLPSGNILISSQGEGLFIVRRP